MANATAGGKQVAIVRPMQFQSTTSSSNSYPRSQSPVCGRVEPTPRSVAVLTKSSLSSTLKTGIVKHFNPGTTSATSCSRCGHMTSSPNDVEDCLKRCPYYFGSFSAAQANKLLASQSVGTYLLRNSSDPRYPFALSVQTHRGPTSIRISRTPTGCVQLDCADRQQTLMKRFDDIFQLIRHYVRAGSSNECVFLEKNGRADTPIVLIRSIDVAMSHTVQPLAVLCRTIINSARMDRTVPMCTNCYVDLLPSSDEITAKSLRLNPFEM